MLLPMLAMALPAAPGLGGPTGHAMTMLAHVALIAGMAAMMVYRRERCGYAAHSLRA